MSQLMTEAEKILRDWKGDRYSFGRGVLWKIGEYVKEHGDKTILCSNFGEWLRPFLKEVKGSLKANKIDFSTTFGARENAPREDIYRIALQIMKNKPDSIISIGGGSTIDACKAASVLSSYSTEEVKDSLAIDELTASTVEPFFGANNVTKVAKTTGKKMIPVIAVQTAAGSAAHLTKYSNITDPVTSQKKLIVDDAIIPDAAVFDYNLTFTAPERLTLDGGLDGLAHIWEVFMGAIGKSYYETVKKIAIIATKMILRNLPVLIREKRNVDSRTAICLATDLGGYAIMIGGTSGAHLGSFSLVDILTHGRACAILNPYYSLFFSENIQNQLRVIGEIYKEEGLISQDINSLRGRELGVTVAEGMIRFLEKLDVPTNLKDVGATEEHIQRMLSATKNPQLKMKLLNMPTPLDPEKGDIDHFMKPILDAAYYGDLSLIENAR